MATNYAKASYTEIIDLQTVRDKCSIVGIHTPTGSAPYLKLRGFFTAFRKFRYKGVSSCRMVPAANLPVDPLGLTGIVGTTDLMDPRDNLNPILFHGAHGESLDMVIDRFFASRSTTTDPSNNPGVAYNPTSGYISSSADCLEDDMSKVAIESRYYARLTDPTWRKFGIQSGVSLKRLVPLTWKLSQSIPLVPGWNSPYTGTIGIDNSTNAFSPSSTGGVSGLSLSSVTGGVPDVMDNSGDTYSAFRTMPQMFTNGVSRLGWLPTTTYGFATGQKPVPCVTVLPKLFMGILVLPPAYNVEQFFRLAITHVFEFKEFTCSLGPMDEVAHPTDPLESAGVDTPGYRTSYFNWIDYTETGEKKVIASDPVSEGTTLDVINGSSEVVSDGVL